MFSRLRRDRRPLCFAFCAMLALSTVAASTAQGQSSKKRRKGKQPTKKRDGNLPSTRRAVPIRIAKVDPATAERVTIGAQRIDTLVEENYRKHGISPNSLTTDSQFVRRIYLDITGTIPTLEQTEAFLKSKDSKKRQRLIDRLLNSPGYASHFYNFWADVLRLVDRPSPNVIATPYSEWVKQAQIGRASCRERV